jgi:hypothetical protein
MGCEPEQNAFCGEDLVTWVCSGAFDYQSFMDAGCMDPGTQVPRMCCPAEFLSECQ